MYSFRKPTYFIFAVFRFLILKFIVYVSVPHQDKREALENFLNVL